MHLNIDPQKPWNVHSNGCQRAHARSIKHL